MSAIKQALANLDAAIGKLEHSVTHYQRSTQSQVEVAQAKAQAQTKKAQETEARLLEQSDMFSDVDPALVSQKLDNAIKKVESVLEDAA